MAQTSGVCKYVRKGNAILVCGSLQTKNYTNQNGQKVYIAEVLADEISFAGNKNDNLSEHMTTPTANGYIPDAYGGNSDEFEQIDTYNETSLPF